MTLTYKDLALLRKRFQAMTPEEQQVFQVETAEAAVGPMARGLLAMLPLEVVAPLKDDPQFDARIFDLAYVVLRHVFAGPSADSFAA